MKKHLHGIIAVLLMLCVCGTALASNVDFVNIDEGFLFLPSDDLFPEFKNAMPGDTLTQLVEVANRKPGYIVRLYIRADPVDEEHKAFLDQLHLTVKDLGTGEIFNAQASETAQLTEDHLLGIFRNNMSTTLEVTLEIPKDLSNDFNGARGDVHWTFTADTLPMDAYGNTGDWFETGVWVAAAVMIAAALTVLLIIWRRRTKEEM